MSVLVNTCLIYESLSVRLHILVKARHDLSVSARLSEEGPLCLHVKQRGRHVCATKLVHATIDFGRSSLWKWRTESCLLTLSENASETIQLEGFLESLVAGVIQVKPVRVPTTTRPGFLKNLHDYEVGIYFTLDEYASWKSEADSLKVDTSKLAMDSSTSVSSQDTPDSVVTDDSDTLGHLREVLERLRKDEQRLSDELAVQEVKRVQLEQEQARLIVERADLERMRMDYIAESYETQSSFLERHSAVIAREQAVSSVERPEPFLALHVMCRACYQRPVEATATGCGHVLCMRCAEGRLDCGGTCSCPICYTMTSIVRMML